MRSGLAGPCGSRSRHFLHAYNPPCVEQCHSPCPVRSRIRPIPSKASCTTQAISRWCSPSADFSQKIPPAWLSGQRMFFSFAKRTLSLLFGTQKSIETERPRSQQAQAPNPSHHSRRIASYSGTILTSGQRTAPTHTRLPPRDARPHTPRFPQTMPTCKGCS